MENLETGKDVKIVTDEKEINLSEIVKDDSSYLDFSKEVYSKAFH